MKRSILSTSLAVFAGLGLVAGAHADTVSGGSFNNAEETTEINQSGTLNRFDSTSGTLTQVTLTLTNNSTTSLSLTNTAQTAVNNVQGISNTNFFWDTTGLGTQLSGLNPVSPANQLDTGFNNYASGQTRDFGPSPAQVVTVITLTAGDAGFSDFNAPPGSATFDLLCSTVSGLTLVGGGGNIDSSQATTAGCAASLSYEFTPGGGQPAPTPATLALMGLGLLGMSRFRRKRG